MLQNRIIMKLNFKELRVFNIARTKETIVDAREIFADAISGNIIGFEAHNLCHKIFESDGDEDYTDREVELIQQYSSLGTGQFIDAVLNMIETAKKQENESIQESGAAAGD